MKKIIALTAGLISAGAVFSQMSPEGLWRTTDDKTGQPKAEIRITANGGVLSGVVEKALMPSPEPLCTVCTDDRKDKPKLGMEIIRGAKKAEGKDLWDGGKILDPENGKNYTLTMEPEEGGKKLKVRGYIGPFYRTQIWLRVQ
jgi:uncharacterized protein (DUF2147 family)